MKIIVSAIAGVLFMLSVTVAIVAVTHHYGLWLTKSQANLQAHRSAVLMAVYIELRRHQQRFEGERDANGCFMFPPDNPLQTDINLYNFTSDELGQTIDELLCRGFIIPADL